MIALSPKATPAKTGSSVSGSIPVALVLHFSHIFIALALYKYL
jgi:hypothetical protein